MDTYYQLLFMLIFKFNYFYTIKKYNNYYIYLIVFHFKVNKKKITQHIDKYSINMENNYRFIGIYWKCYPLQTESVLYKLVQIDLSFYIYRSDFITHK